MTRATSPGLFLLLLLPQKRRAQHRIELAVIIGDLFALADVAGGDRIAVAPLRVRVVGMVDVVVVVDGEQHFAVGAVAVVLQIVARRFRAAARTP